MPELPEVECLRRSLEPHLLGRRIVSAELRRSDFCTVSPGYPRGSPPGELLLAGAVVKAMHRVGKHLALEADDGRVLEIHLGMSGQVRVHEDGSAEEPDRHVHAMWRLGRDHRAGAVMTLRDPRRFGGLWAFRSLETLHSERWCVVGPDALTIEAQTLASRLQHTSRAIKTTLLDQAILAGVGNIYADEALFAAGIHPQRPARRLSRAEVDVLANVIRSTLANAIQAKGSTLRDYADANGQSGESQLMHHVYGRGGEPCSRCGTVLKSIVLAQRTTTFCPACQPRNPGRTPAGTRSRARM
jgi:formamidopyrimidine-DNA glycosylase